MQLHLLAVLMVAALGASSPAAGQAERTARIGVLLQVPPSEAAVAPLWKALVEGLREHGWEEGRNLVIEGRFGGRDSTRFPEFAAELAALKVDAILAANPHSIEAARQATSKIPIIMMGGQDPVGAGWIESLSRPGRNITGVTAEYETVIGKHLELLKEIKPGVERIGVIYTPENPAAMRLVKNMQDDMAARLGLVVLPYPIRTPENVKTTFDRIARDRPDAVEVLGGEPVIQAHRFEVAAFAVRQRLPTVTALKVLVPDGLLMSYAHDPAAAFRRAAWYVDRILKGADPAELPVELMGRFELVINLKTARSIGLEVPPTLLARADEVIE
jgi:putative ABC transport system substrate-binding protein